MIGKILCKMPLESLKINRNFKNDINLVLLILNSLKKKMKLEEFWLKLRNDHRLKLNCDFSYTFKYNELHILCSKHFKDEIEEQAIKFGILINSFHAY
jgi:hypothetical protein